MELLQKLEKTLVKVYAGLPHLPNGGKKWLLNNFWWIVLILVIATTLSVLASLRWMFAFNFGFTWTWLPVQTVGMFSYFWMMAALGLIANIVFIVMAASSISPLKAQKPNGWKLLFGALTVSAAVVAVSDILQLDIMGFVLGIVTTLIELYFVFEVRDSFLGLAKAKPNDKSSADKNTTK